MPNIEQVIEQNFADEVHNGTDSGNSDNFQFDVAKWSAIGTIVVGITSAVRLYLDYKQGDI